MKSLSTLICAIVFALCLSTTAFAQDDNPFLLTRGDNEFGFWAGFSPKATTMFEGLREFGGGVRIFTSERRAVNIGLKFHHISNGDRAGSNRGLNHFVIYAGFSIFK